MLAYPERRCRGGTGFLDCPGIFTTFRCAEIIPPMSALPVPGPLWPPGLPATLPPRPHHLLDALLLGDGAAAAAGDWPRLVNAVDAAALWRELGRQGLADELRLEPGPARYVGAWPLVNMSPDKHLGYALQWFALAATLLGLTVWLAVSSTRGGMR